MIKNEIGNKYGEWTVLERAYSYGGKVYWKCQCSCGTTREIRGDTLRSGKSTSCGCKTTQLLREKNRKVEDITNKKFGKLLVLERAADKEKSSGRLKDYWLCKCDCGNTCIVSGHHLKYNHTTSCGCTKSIGESKIGVFLTNNNIPFIHQYVFNDLKGPNGGNLFFDYYIEYNNNYCLIEYQGIQHYIDLDFGRQQREITDVLKKEYCKKNNINLFYIDYNENIEEKLKEILQKL